MRGSSGCMDETMLENEIAKEVLRKINERTRQALAGALQGGHKVGVMSDGHCQRLA